MKNILLEIFVGIVILSVVFGVTGLLMWLFKYYPIVIYLTISNIVLLFARLLGFVFLS